MGMHTAAKMAHYAPMEDGRQALIWTPSQGEIPLGDVIRGSREAREIMAHEDYVLNALTDEGENAILESFFRNNHTPTFHLGLWNDGAIAETDTIASLTAEQSGAGYARIPVVRGTSDWGAAALDAGDHKTTSATKQFSASGTWIQSQDLVLVSPLSGTAGSLYAWIALSPARTLGSGDTLDVNMGVKLS